MHFLENYALQLGQKISQPFICETFFPLPFKKYLVIQPFSKSSKNYDLWSEVIDFISPELEKLEIKIVQVGGPNEKPLPHCYNTSGSTTFNQMAYIIKNSIGYIGADSIGAHFSGYYNIPLLTLVSNNYIECVRPFFGDKDKQIILEPKRDGKPSFSLEEFPKSINLIKIETILSSIEKLFKIKMPQIKTIHIGSDYHESTVLYVPNFQINLQIINSAPIHVRFDYLNELTPINYQHTLQLAAQRKVIIYTDKPFNLDPFKQVRQNIAAIVYRMGEQDDIDFVKSLKRGGFQHRVVKEYTPETLSLEQIAALKFKYLDVSPIQFVEKKKTTLDFKDGLMYISKRIVFSNNMIFRSKNSFEKGLTEKENQLNIPDIETLKNLEKEAEYLYIYQKQ